MIVIFVVPIDLTSSIISATGQLLGPSILSYFDSGCYARVFVFQCDCILFCFKSCFLGGQSIALG